MNAWTRVAQQCGTDKGAHGYMDHYHRLLDGHAVNAVLEIGVYEGGSLALWRELWPDATIVGIDTNPDCVKHRADNTYVYTLDATQPASPPEVARHGPFDLIVDDASHVFAHQNMTYLLFRSLLAEGGVYVIEDIWLPAPTVELHRSKTWDNLAFGVME